MPPWVDEVSPVEYPERVVNNPLIWEPTLGVPHPILVRQRRAPVPTRPPNMAILLNLFFSDHSSIIKVKQVLFMLRSIKSEFIWSIDEREGLKAFHLVNEVFENLGRDLVAQGL